MQVEGNVTAKFSYKETKAIMQQVVTEMKNAIGISYQDKIEEVIIRFYSKTPSTVNYSLISNSVRFEKNFLVATFESIAKYGE